MSVSGMITVPMSAQMYQTMVANIQHLQPNSDGTLCLTPMQVHSSNNSANFSTYVMAGHKLPATTEISTTFHPKMQISAPSVANASISKKKLKNSNKIVKSRLHSHLINNNKANIQNKNLIMNQTSSEADKKLTKPNSLTKDVNTVVIEIDEEKESLEFDVKEKAI